MDCYVKKRRLIANFTTNSFLIRFKCAKKQKTKTIYPLYALHTGGYKNKKYKWRQTLKVHSNFPYRCIILFSYKTGAFSRPQMSQNICICHINSAGRVHPLPKQYQNLDPSYEMGLDFWIALERKTRGPWDTTLTRAPVHNCNHLLLELA